MFPTLAETPLFATPWPVVAALLCLTVGPVVYEFARQARLPFRALDGFVLVTVGGLALVHVLPHSFSEGGIPAVALALVGFAGPFTIDRLGERATRAGHRLLALVVIAGLIPHAFVDGVALCAGGHAGEGPAHEHLLSVAVVLHRLPVGFALWWLVRPGHGAPRAVAALVAISIATVAGYSWGRLELSGAPLAAFPLLEGLVGGALLHVFLHKPHGGPQGRPIDRPARSAEALGALAGGAMLWLLPGPHEHAREAAETVSAFARSLLDLALASGPPLLIGFLAAGLLSVYLSSRSVAWLGRGRPWSQSLLGTLYGLPLPICSCGVVPVYRSLVGRGVPASAALAFLVAAPELGVDSILLSLPLLGGQLALARVLCALATAVVVGRFVGPLADGAGRAALPPAPAGGDREGRFVRLARALRIGFADVFDETAPWILAGLLIAAALAPVSLQEWLGLLPPGLDVPLFALAGIPVYICASGATPLAAVLVLKGLSPGAAVALLLTGPATNVTTFGILTRLHGRRAALRFIAWVMAVSVAGGLLVNLVVDPASLPLRLEGEREAPSLFSWSCLILLALVLIMCLFRLGPRAFIGRLFASGHIDASGGVDGAEEGLDSAAAGGGSCGQESPCCAPTPDPRSPSGGPGEGPRSDGART